MCDLTGRAQPAPGIGTALPHVAPSSWLYMACSQQAVNAGYNSEHKDRRRGCTWPAVFVFSIQYAVHNIKNKEG